MMQTQRALGDVFSELSQKNPELREEFTYNSETQRVLCRNGETLLGAFCNFCRFFVGLLYNLILITFSPLESIHLTSALSFQLLLLDLLVTDICFEICSLS